MAELLSKSAANRDEIKQVLATPQISFGVAKEKIGLEINGVFCDESGRWRAVCSFIKNGELYQHTSEIQIDRSLKMMFVFLPLGKKDEPWNGLKLVNIEHLSERGQD